MREFPYSSLNLVHKSSLLSVVFCITLLTLVVSPSIFLAHATTPYLPAVVAGQFAQYKVLKDSCQSSVPQICQAIGTYLNDSMYAAVQVVGVSGPTVALELVSIYKNGTGAHAGGMVNVATGTSNVTIFSQVVNDYFLLAGNLQAPDQIWATTSARSLGGTSNEMILGQLRTVNFLNFTVSGSQYGTNYSGPAGFAFDQSSGFLIEFTLKLSSSGTSTTELDLRIGMVDNNLWGNGHLPDFDLSAYPTMVNATANTPVSSTITLHRLYGFSAIVNLSATSSSNGVSCSVSPNSLSMGGSDTTTLSCGGSPGAYTVTVEGNGGYSKHNSSISITVRAAPMPTQPASTLSIPLIYGGIGVAAAVAALVTLLFLRRRPRQAVVAPSDP